jgi:hypothetical protein
MISFFIDTFDRCLFNLINKKLSKDNTGSNGQVPIL